MRVRKSKFTENQNVANLGQSVTYRSLDKGQHEHALSLQAFTAGHG